MKQDITPFAERDNKTVYKYTFTTPKGVLYSVINYGATLIDVQMPDKNGKSAHLITGFDDLESYKSHPFYFGATIGRFGNRIAEASFTLDGKKYELQANNGPNNLHGGPEGYDSVLWNAETFESDDKAGVIFTYTSPDGQSGFPGTLNLTVTYTFTDQGEMILNYRAETDSPTPVNLTNHTYWNMAGVGGGVTVLDQKFKLNSAAFTPVDENLIPTGVIQSVEGTPMDFREFKAVGFDAPQGGYDHNWVLDGEGLREAAVLIDENSGRKLTLLTNQPGIQVFSAHGIDVMKERTGETYSAMALALETQNFPNCVNEPAFPDCIVRPGDVYDTTTVFKLELLG